MPLAVVTQLAHLVRQASLVLLQPAQTPADQARDQQQRQPGQKRNGYRRPGFLPVHGDLHGAELLFNRLRESFNPLPVHRFVAVHPEDLLGQHLL